MVSVRKVKSEMCGKKDTKKDVDLKPTVTAVKCAVSDPLQDAEQQADAVPGGGWGWALMSYENFSAIKAKVQGAFDDVEAWIFQAFEGPVQDLDIDEDLELELAQRRRGMRFFAAGRARDGKRFASILFPLFQGDPNKDLYEEAFCDVLRVAGNSVKPGSRHKLSFRAGVLFFTADSLGNTYGVVASDDFPLANAYNFLEEMLQVYHSIDVEIALNEAGATYCVKEEALHCVGWGVAKCRDRKEVFQNLGCKGR
ncbi:hypothetical protein AK812_SmicGene7334 [Symbiodinium microadriaticum]|uniref:Uncharacterized protein n=1 Tax=Symbiodinium microadriaticum TaxID=2951 RepID=A0A1Q9ENU5_SYMMI|nr:hypothetical protein AK812_SmicGene7334 [Symbiodinium microadriaticum]